MLHVSKPLTGIGGAVLEVDLAAVLELGLVDVVHVHGAGVVLVLLVQPVAAAVAHVVAVLRVHLAELRPDALARDHASTPRLQTHDHVDVLGEVAL